MKYRERMFVWLLFWALVAVAIATQGCSTSERFLVAGVAADLGVTVYGLDRGAVEVGVVSGAWGDDNKEAIIALDIGVVLVRRWLGRKYPGWRGWTWFDYSFGSVRFAVAIDNYSEVN